MNEQHSTFSIGYDAVGIEVDQLDITSGQKSILKVERLLFPAKGIVAVMGPSGCGKSSLLKTMAHLHDDCIKSSGNIHLLSKSMDLPSHHQIFSMVWQQPTVFPTTIWNNLKLPLKKRQIPKRDWRVKMEAVLAATGLLEELDTDWPEQNAHCISGGQQQRLSIAMGMLKDSPVMLLDEPTSALDPISTEKIERIIKQLGNQKLVILVTHSIGQARRVSEYTAIFCIEEHHGYLCEFGLTEHIFNDPKTQESRRFILQETGA